MTHPHEPPLFDHPDIST